LAYFHEVLDVIGSLEIIIGFSGDKNPVVLVPCEDGDRREGYVNVIMPMESDTKADAKGAEGQARG